MKKERHKWGELKKTKYTHFQKCIKCQLYRFNALGCWMYTKENPDLNPFCEHVINEGCNGSV